MINFYPLSSSLGQSMKCNLFSEKNTLFPKCAETPKNANIFFSLYLWARAWRKMFSGTDPILLGTGPILWGPVLRSPTHIQSIRSFFICFNHILVKLIRLWKWLSPKKAQWLWLDMVFNSTYKKTDCTWSGHLFIFYFNQ